MDKRDYLNPETVRIQGRKAIERLEDEQKNLHKAEEKIQNFIDDSNVDSEAFSQVKRQMLDFLSVVGSMIKAIDYDISDHNKYMDAVGDEILDGEKIITMLECFKRLQREHEEYEQLYRAKSYNGIDVLSNSYRLMADNYAKKVQVDEEMIRTLRDKMDKFDDICADTRNLFEESEAIRIAITQGISSINNAFTGSGFSFDMNAPWRKTLTLAAYDIQIPNGLSETERASYKETVLAQISNLEEKGWVPASIKEYAAYINKNIASKYSGINAIEQLDKYNKDTEIVGSEVFINMWNAWSDKTEQESKQKLNTLMKVTGMKELEGNAAQVEELLNHFDKNLAPHDKFWESLATTVQNGYPDGIKGDEISGSPSEILARNIHQFRYVIDAQQVNYIRYKYSDIGGTDEDKLAAYLASLDSKDYALDESSRLHNKKNKYTDEYPQGLARDKKGEALLNYKVLVKFHSEYILDGDGKFLYILDSKATENSVVNGASFNYGNNDYLKKDMPWEMFGKSTHDVHDVETPKKYDPEFRKIATKDYISPVPKEYFGETPEDKVIKEREELSEKIKDIK